MSELTLEKLYNTKFSELYKRLLKNKKLNNKELEKILSIGIILVCLDDEKLNRLGYKIFLLYTRATRDYKPLYELSLNKGLIPIVKFIEKDLKYLTTYGNIYTEINSIISDAFNKNNIYYTFGQLELNEQIEKFKFYSQIIVAPTSYGKTELILSFIECQEFNRICVVSPTKSLVMQTKKRIIDKVGNLKTIITYPEMYDSNSNEILAVLTQERLLRLLQNNCNLYFDLLIIDEAHNLLEGYSEENLRSVILASVIVICNKRNNNMVCKYLTPFLNNKKSLDIQYLSEENEYYKVKENIKSELFYFYDILNNEKLLLDQYSPNKEKLIQIKAPKLGEDSDIVINNADKKNIIYLNNPKKLEEFANELHNKLPLIKSERLSKAADDLREYVHEKYKLAYYLEKGIVYHHGSIPESVRYYIECLYAEIPEIKFLIANSTLLEGVNIPATKMFILDPSKGNNILTLSSFKNLIGRVCRFREIFDKSIGDLNYLLPEIHIIKGKYCRSNFNIKNFIEKQKLSVKDYNDVDDEVKNPLLKGYNKNDEKFQKTKEILENISSLDSIIDGYKRKPKTTLGKLCFENNISIFNIFDFEEKISKELSTVIKIDNLDNLFLIMNKVFFSKIYDTNNLSRLKNEKAQNFYKTLINWKIDGLNMKEMINRFVNYWNKLPKSSTLVYVGKWGDRTRNGFKKYWIDIFEKKIEEKINLAIVRLKEEYDFIDNEIIKYIEVLYSLHLIDESLYLKIKYGTDIKDRIIFLNCGISSVLLKLLEDKYQNFYSIDFNKKNIIYNKKLVEEMIKNRENGVLIYEVKLNLKE